MQHLFRNLFNFLFQFDVKTYNTMRRTILINFLLSLAID